MSIGVNVLKMDIAKHNPNTANYLQKYMRTLNNLKLTTAHSELERINQQRAQRDPALDIAGREKFLCG
jgi:hypothetical protein